MYIKPNDKNFYDFNNMDLIESCQLNYNDLIRSTQSGDSLSILNFYEFFNKIPKNKYYLINLHIIKIIIVLYKLLILQI